MRHVSAKFVEVGDQVAQVGTQLFPIWGCTCFCFFLSDVQNSECLIDCDQCSRFVDGFKVYPPTLFGVSEYLEPLILLNNCSCHGNPTNYQFYTGLAGEDLGQGGEGEGRRRRGLEEGGGGGGGEERAGERRRGEECEKNMVSGEARMQEVT